ISSPFEELSDIGSPRADDHEQIMLPEMLEDPYVEVALQAPPSPDYIPGPEEPEQAPHSLDYSPEYVPEDDDDEDPEEDPVDYPVDGGDDGDDEEESSEDDDMDIEADEKEEHPAPSDSVVVAPTATDQASSAEETEPFETDIIPFPPLPSILSPPSPVLSPAPHPSPIRSLGYRAAMIRLRDEAASTSSPPLQLPSASRREDKPKVTLPPQKRLGIALGPRYKVGKSSSAAAARPAGGLRADYGFVTIVDREIMRDPEREVRATYASDLVHGEVMSLRTTVVGQMSEIRELQAADYRRQTVISKLLRIDHKRSTEISELRTALQGQVTALQGQVTALQAHVTTLQGQQGVAEGPTQSGLPEEAGGSA
nr:hypothetical protein [Tanacetum cinerariifolium]